MIKKSMLYILGIVLLSGTLWIAVAARHASTAARTWRDVQAALSMHDTNALTRLIQDAEYDLYEILDDRFYYFNNDLTEQLINSRVDYRRTIEYYMTDKSRKSTDKVVLGGGYALIQTGRVTWVIFP